MCHTNTFISQQSLEELYVSHKILCACFLPFNSSVLIVIKSTIIYHLFGKRISCGQGWLQTHLQLRVTLSFEISASISQALGLEACSLTPHLCGWNPGLLACYAIPLPTSYTPSPHCYLILKSIKKRNGG